MRKLKNGAEVVPLWLIQEALLQEQQQSTEVPGRSEKEMAGVERQATTQGEKQQEEQKEAESQL